MKKGTRKLLIALISLAGFFLCFAISSKFSGENLVYGVCGISIAFITGNAVASFSKRGA